MMTLSLAAQAVKGRIEGMDALFSAVTTDSRRVAAGDLFVALKGERFDGHDFVAQCLEQGAAAAMVRPISSERSASAAIAAGAGYQRLPSVIWRRRGVRDSPYRSRQSPAATARPR